MCEAVANDTNGDTVSNVGDTFGYAYGDGSQLIDFMTAAGIDTAKINEEGKVELVINTEKTAQWVEKMYQIYEKPNVYSANPFKAKEERISFKNGMLLFNASSPRGLISAADYSFDVGMLPHPKWDEAQEEYYTMVDGSHQALAVPVTASSLDMIGAVTEVLNAESWKLVTPAYYDVALKVKATRDNESVEMLDLIMDSRIFDFGYVYDGWGGPSFLLADFVANKNTDFESTYASKEKAIMSQYDKVIDFFENYDG